MISVAIRAERAVERLRARCGDLRARVRENFAAGADALLGLVRTNLSGAVLRPGSGALRDSVRAEMSEDASGFAARVWSDGSVPYARIQEYGGRIAVPEILPNRAKALAFVYGGRMVFAKSARAHVVDIPERSYMRTALAEFAPAFLEGVRKVAAESLP